MNYDLKSAGKDALGAESSTKKQRIKTAIENRPTQDLVIPVDRSKVLEVLLDLALGSNVIKQLDHRGTRRVTTVGGSHGGTTCRNRSLRNGSRQRDDSAGCLGRKPPRGSAGRGRASDGSEHLYSLCFFTVMWERAFRISCTSKARAGVLSHDESLTCILRPSFSAEKREPHVPVPSFCGFFAF